MSIVGIVMFIAAIVLYLAWYKYSMYRIRYPYTVKCDKCGKVHRVALFQGGYFPEDMTMSCWKCDADFPVSQQLFAQMQD